MGSLYYLEDAFSVFPSLGVSTLIPVFTIIMYWLVFEKANESGWKILIPFYGEYIIYKIAKKEKLFWWKLGIVIVTGILSLIVMGFTIYIGFKTEGIHNLILLFIAVALYMFGQSIALLVLRIKRSIALSKVFGQTTAFGIGILFLEPIFIAILALNSNIQYHSEDIPSNDFLSFSSDEYDC